MCRLKYNYIATKILLAKRKAYIKIKIINFLDKISFQTTVHCETTL